MEVCYLQVADDVILFLEYDNRSISNIFALIHVLEHISGLKINMGKSGFVRAMWEMTW